MEQSIVDYVPQRNRRWHENEILTNIYKASMTVGDNSGLTDVILSHWSTQ